MFGAARVSRGEPTGDGPTWQEVGARKPRSVLAALALHAGRPVSADVLADLVWAGEPPRAAHGALHAYISGVRKSLDPDRTTRSVASVLETTDHGYLLRVEADDVDAHRFVRDVRRIERVLAPLATQLTSGDRNDWPGRSTVLASLDELDAVLGDLDRDAVRRPPRAPRRGGGARGARAGAYGGRAVPTARVAGPG